MTVTVAIAGARGTAYARLARANGAAVVAVAETDPARRAALAPEHSLPATACFSDWRDLAGRPRLADAAVVATPDRQHADPACALATLGYTLLLEKPMATNPEDAERIVQAAVRHDVLLVSVTCCAARPIPWR